MKKHLMVWTMAALASVAPGVSRGQGAPSQAQGGAASAAAQNRVVGQVTGVDASTGQVTVKTEDGRSVVVKTDERTALLRIPPGETKADKAVKIGLSDISVGDRIFARGSFSGEGQPLAARQLVVTSGATATGAQAAGRDDARNRGINGRITAVNAQTKEITLMARGRDGAGPILVDASGNVRFLRYAPDSTRSGDARPGSFADLKVGDMVRARGERSSDGARFTAEEIISGSIIRFGGTVTAVNAATSELTIKDGQTGRTMTVAIGAKSSLRRIPPEVAATMAQRRMARNERGPAGGARGGEGGANNGPANNGPANNGPASGQQSEGRERTPGEGRRREGPGGVGGRNFQEMLESLPAITLSDLKKGDAVFVMGTRGTESSRATAVTLITGDADFINRLQFQGRPGDRDGRGASPGLPGDVLGGGADNRDRP